MFPNLCAQELCQLGTAMEGVEDPGWCRLGGAGEGKGGKVPELEEGPVVLGSHLYSPNSTHMEALHKHF